jgi:23S rRNA pseudouridine2605 synthase
MSEKLQKVLARAGIGSRRQIEEWIAQGIISVNDKKVKLGDRIDVTTNPVIKINGSPVKIDFSEQKEQESMVLLYHKPIGEICSRNDEAGRPTVFDNLPPLDQGRWVIVGRLDFNTSGVLLFTNDGELANQLMHPSSEVEREYLVRVLGEVSDQVLERLMRGVQLEDGLAKAKSVLAQGGSGANQWYRMTLAEGKNREVRRLWESQNLKVSRLIRIRFANISLPRELKAGRYELLLPQEVKALKNLARKK